MKFTIQREDRDFNAIMVHFQIGRKCNFGPFRYRVDQTIDSNPCLFQHLKDVNRENLRKYTRGNPEFTKTLLNR